MNKNEVMEGHFVTRADAAEWIDSMMKRGWRIWFFGIKGPMLKHGYPVHVQMEQVNDTKK